MRIPEIFLISLFIVSLLFRVFHLPGGVILSVLAGGSFILYYSIGGYWIFSAKDKVTGIKQNAPGLSVFSGILFGLCFLPIVFKVMSWPGANFGFVFFIPLTIIFFDINLIMIFTSDKKIYFRNMTIRFGFISFISLFLLMMPANSFYKLQYRNDPEQIRLWDNRNSSPEAYHEYERYIDSVNQK